MQSTNKRRFNKTLKMLKSIVPICTSIFDLEVENEFLKIMNNNGYKVSNNIGEDLDLKYLVSPYPLFN